MRTVRGPDDTTYLLLKRSGDASLVRDPATGEERYVENDRLDPAGGASPLGAAAEAVPEGRRRLVTAVRDERSLGLLVELDRRGPTAVRTLMGAYDLCESDMHGLLAEFRAAGLIEERAVAGERGYALTGPGSDALDALR